MSVLKKSVWKRSKEFDKLKEGNFFGTQPIEEVYEARHKKDKFCVMLRVDYGKENAVTYCAVFKNGIKGDLNSKLTWEERIWIIDTLFDGKKFALELYPEENRCLDRMDIYHLWAYDAKTAILPFNVNFNERAEQTKYGTFMHEHLPTYLGWREKQNLKNSKYGPIYNGVEIIDPRNPMPHMVVFPYAFNMFEDLDIRKSIAYL